MSNEREGHSNPSAPQLNPDAESLLTTSLDEVRRDVLRLAARSQAARPNPPSELTVGEVKEALDELGLAAARMQRISRPILFVSFGIGGLILLAVGIFSTVAASPRGLTAILASVATVMGSIAASWSFWTTRTTITRAELADRAIEEARVLRGWAALERAMMERIGELPESRSNLPRVIQRYAATAQLSSGDVDELRGILRVRNEVAHSPTGSSIKNPEVLREVLAAIDRQLDKASGEIKPSTYESLALANLQILLPDAITARSEIDFGADAHIRLPDGKLFDVIVKYSRQSTSTHTSLRKWSEKVQNKFVPLLIITNIRLPHGQPHLAVDVRHAPVWAASWRSSYDNQNLRVAVELMLQEGGDSTEPS